MFFHVYELVFFIWVRFCNQLFCINCFSRFNVGYYTPVFSTLGLIYTKSNVIFHLYLWVKFFLFVRFCKCYGQCIYICDSDISHTLCFCFFVLNPWMFQLIIECKLVCPRKLGLINAMILLNCCCTLCITTHKKYGHSQFFASFTGTHPGYWGGMTMWGKVGLCACCASVDVWGRWRDWLGV